MLLSYLLVYCGVFRYIYFCSMTVHVLLLWAKLYFLVIIYLQQIQTLHIDALCGHLIIDSSK